MNDISSFHLTEQRGLARKISDSGAGKTRKHGFTRNYADCIVIHGQLDDDYASLGGITCEGQQNSRADW